MVNAHVQVHVHINAQVHGVVNVLIMFKPRCKFTFAFKPSFTFVLQCRCVAVSELVQTRARLGASSKRQFKCHATIVPVGAQGRCVTANLCLHVRVGMDVNLDSIFAVISALSFAYAFPTTSLAPAFAFAGSISTPNRTFKPKSKPASRFGP